MLNENSRTLSIALKLQNYQFTPVYIKGETKIADLLSRAIEESIVSQIETLRQNDREQIMKQYHLASGHGSSNNMKFLIGKRYKWKNMYKEIDNFVDKCTICIRSGDARVNSKNRVILPNHPNELWEIDLKGRIPLKRNGNIFILVAIDHYSK